MPVPIRLLLLFLIGAVAGSLINLVVCRYGLEIRRISPWLKSDDELSGGKSGNKSRSKSDKSNIWLRRIPIIGWLMLDRATIDRLATQYGRLFRVRPLLVELLMGVGLPALYWWEVVQLGLVSPGYVAPSIDALHAMFFGHAVLVVLMLAASLIDADDFIIPDIVTIPGTLFAILLLTVTPSALLPVWEVPAQEQFSAEQIQRMSPQRLQELRQLAEAREDSPKESTWLTPFSPHGWPVAMEGMPKLGSLALGVVCWLVWCWALMPHTWTMRYGLRRAVRYCMARRLHRENRWIWAMAVVGTFCVAVVWSQGGTHWHGLLAALLGMIGGGGMVWAVRIVGRYSLGREAMGFGDVTLMFMIGAMVGWQTSLVIFFLAPLAGVLLGILNWLVHRDTEIPYGPFLCLATLFAILYWVPIWDRIEMALYFRGLVPALFAGCMVLMGLMLGGLRLARMAFGRK